MKIVHLYKDYFPPTYGGIEQVAARMAVAQARAGHEVTVLTSAHGERRDVDERVEGVRVLRMSEWARFASAPLCPGMPAALGRLQAEVFHLHYPSPPGEVSWLLRRPRGAMVVTYHSDIVRQKIVLPIYAPCIRAVLAAADTIMPTSAAYVERSEFLRPHRSKCRVVPLGVDVERFAAAPRSGPAVAALRARYGSPFILFVGRLRAYKGLGVLLRAMTRVNARLVVVGSGPECESLLAEHARLGLGDRVTFVGDLSDAELLAHFGAADIGVLPSILPSEAFGLAMAEMLACGIPMVCTELGTGTSFVNQHERTGLVVPPSDPDALAAALNRLVGDEALRRRMGAAASAWARASLSTEAMNCGVEAAYVAALESRRGRA